MLRLFIPDRVDEDIFIFLSVVEQDYVNLYGEGLLGEVNHTTTRLCVYVATFLNLKFEKWH